MTSSLLANLNPEQLAAVTLPHQSALILAGAGSGKTRVLTTRIAWLLATGQASPLSILAVTFTNKAAKEMLVRLSAMTPMHTRGMWIGTFHGLCNRMLRAHYRDANLPQLFQIMDTQDQLALIKRMYKAHGIDDERFPRGSSSTSSPAPRRRGCARTRSRPATTSRGARSSTTRSTRRCASAKASSISPSSCCEATSSSRSTTACASITGAASRTCSSTSSRTPTCCSTSGCSSSPGEHAAVFAVGDDDQSIYAFRGANVANMQHFERDFARPDMPVAADQARAELSLARQHPRCRQRADQEQPDAARQEPVDERRQGRARARAGGAFGRRRGGVHRRRDEGPRGRRPRACRRSPCSIARTRSRACSSTRSSTRRFPIASTAACASSSAPRSRVRSPTCACSRRPIDDGAFLRIVNFPPRGIGARTLETLTDAARARGHEPVAGGAARAAGRAASRTRASPRSSGSSRRCAPPPRACRCPRPSQHVIGASGLVAHYQNEKDGQDRLDNLDELVNAAQGFLREADLAVDAPIAGAGRRRCRRRPPTTAPPIR